MERIPLISNVYTSNHAEKKKREKESRWYIDTTDTDEASWGRIISICCSSGRGNICRLERKLGDMTSEDEGLIVGYERGICMGVGVICGSPSSGERSYRRRRVWYWTETRDREVKLYYDILTYYPVKQKTKNIKKRDKCSSTMQCVYKSISHPIMILWKY